MCALLRSLSTYPGRLTAPPPPKTVTKEWQEAANERAKEMNINPIHGTSILSQHAAVI